MPRIPVPRPRHLAPALVVIACLAGGVTLYAARVGLPAIAAWNRYVQLTEAQIDDELQRGVSGWTDLLPPAERAAARERLRRGEVLLKRQETLDRGKRIDVPGGMIHHWTGLVFLPGATLGRTVAMAQDYDRHQEFFRDAIGRSKLLRRNGDDFVVFYRLVVRRIVSVVVDVESQVHYEPLDARRLSIRARSTHVAEVVNAGTQAEHERPIGDDSGFVWRVNSYWRIEEKDGGTYLQIEGIALSRDIPFGFAWLIEPIVNAFSRDLVRVTLQAARRVVIGSPTMETSTADNRTHKAARPNP